MSTASFCAPWGGGGGVNEMKHGWFSGGAWASMTTDDADWICESTLWSFLYLTGQRGGMCGDGDKNQEPDTAETTATRLYISIFPCVTYTCISISLLKITVKLVRSYIGTRQPWFGDNKSLIPQTQSTRMKKVLAEPKCADHAGWVFLTDCICDCRYQLLYRVFLIQGVPPHAGHAVCCSRIPPPALN